MSHSPGVASLERIEALLRNEALYALAALIPAAPSEHGGRPRDYPDFMLLVFDSLLGVYRSGRQVEAELSHPVTWRFMRRLIRRRFPDDPSKHLPTQPMRRHHYLYGRNRYLSCPEVLEGIGRLHRELATQQAQEIGLLDPGGRAPGPTRTYPGCCTRTARS